MLKRYFFVLCTFTLLSWSSLAETQFEDSPCPIGTKVEKIEENRFGCVSNPCPAGQILAKTDSGFTCKIPLPKGSYQKFCKDCVATTDMLACTCDGKYATHKLVCADGKRHAYEHGRFVCRSAKEILDGLYGDFRNWCSECEVHQHDDHDVLECLCYHHDDHYFHEHLTGDDMRGPETRSSVRLPCIRIDAVSGLLKCW